MGELAAAENRFWGQLITDSPTSFSFADVISSAGLSFRHEQPCGASGALVPTRLLSYRLACVSHGLCYKGFGSAN